MAEYLSRRPDDRILRLKRGAAIAFLLRPPSVSSMAGQETGKVTLGNLWYAFGPPWDGRDCRWTSRIGRPAGWRRSAARLARGGGRAARRARRWWSRGGRPAGWRRSAARLARGGGRTAPR